MLEVHRIVTGSLRENCYVVANSTGDALIIDPGDDAERIVAHLSTRELELLGVLITHAHADHISAAAEIAERTGAPVHMHSADAPLLRRTNFYRVMVRAEAPMRIPSVDIDLAGATSRSFGGMQVGVLHTPGHTPGSVCFSIGDELFTGDTVFDRYLGRTDLPGSNRGALEASVALLVDSIPPDATIRPGHGEASRVGDALSNWAELPELRG